VGRRLAFDAAKGRLWVVCRKCERWNLTPVEERERLFRAARMRASTENIGVARLPEGLELVRIGRPQRPEFAAWRYGDQFGRRRRRTVLVGGAFARLIQPERYPDDITVRLEGDRARRYGRTLLPVINSTGARSFEVREAVRRIEEAGDRHSFLARAPASWTAGTAGAPKTMPLATRLAVEMALHEEEEIAAIADGLLLPQEVDRALGAGPAP
jgi:hypothetical protein